MNSWEVLRNAVERVGVKVVAARLKLSTALIYKWCQESPSSDEPATSGARNPLDRLATIVEATGDAVIVNWLCNRANGFYVPNPTFRGDEPEGHFLGTTQRVVADFGELLSQISQSIENDGQITADEADRIRQSWERLKGQAESFVVACEKGYYLKPSSGHKDRR